MLEGLGNVLLFVLLMVVVVGLAVVAYFFYLYMGWFFIILFIAMQPPPGDVLFSLAMVAFAVYGGTILVALLAYGFYSDQDDLPPALRALAQFLPAPVKRVAGEEAVDLPDLARRTKSGLLTPFTQLEKKFHTWRDQQAAEELRRDTDYQNAQAELHRAAREFNRAKLRAEEAEKARERHDG
jgi:hypothetical protein